MKRLLVALLFAAGLPSFAQNVNIGTKNTTTKDAGTATFANGTFCLKETSGSDKACINAPALSGDTVITMPAITSTLATTATMVGDGGSGGSSGLVPAPATGDATKFLRGDATWATASGGTPAGSGTELQYRNSSSFGATTIQWDSGNSRAGFGTASPISALSNTATTIIDSASAAVITTGISWVSNAAGYAVAIANSSTNTAGFNGLLVKTRSADDGTSIFQADSGAVQGSAATVRFKIGGGGKIGFGTGSPRSTLANTATDIVSSDTTGTHDTNGITWASATGAGFVAGIYNSTNSGANNGLAVKTASAASNTLILDLSTGTTQNAAGTQVFGAYGDGSVRFGTGLSWDSPNSRLNLGTATSTSTLDFFFKKTVAGAMQALVQNASNNAGAYTAIVVANDTGTANNTGMFKLSSAFTTSGLLVADMSLINAGSGHMLVYTGTSSKDVILAAGGAAAANEGLRIKSGVAVMHGYAIGSLPTGTEGAIAFVNDQITACAATGVAPTAGGSLRCPVFYNGSAWVGM